MHLGWAVEGAIGSEHKIDASYLSPNVNLASRLEAATKQYGVSLLLSGSLYDFLTDMKKFCRKIDVVTVKGSNNPITLYTIDIQLENLPLSKKNVLNEQERCEIHQLKKENFLEIINCKNFSSEEFIKKNKDLRLVFEKSNEDFYEIFGNATELYLKGQWMLAKENYEKALQLKKNDGPSNFILRYMKEKDYICPIEWNGYRSLSEK